MAITVTIQNYRASAFPVEENTYDFTEGMVPRIGEYIHLHDQGRLAKVEQVVYMATNSRPGGRTPRLECSAVILVVNGREPRGDFNGRY